MRTELEGRAADSFRLFVAATRPQLTRERRISAWRMFIAFAVVSAVVAGTLTVPPPPPAAAGDPTVRTQTFSYNGASQTFVVPDRIKVVAFNLFGGSGGGIQFGTAGGVRGLILTTPGQSLTVTPGDKGGEYGNPRE